MKKPAPPKMIRLVAPVPEGTYESMRRMAERRGVSLSEFVREAVECHIGAMVLSGAVEDDRTFPDHLG